MSSVLVQLLRHKLSNCSVDVKTLDEKAVLEYKFSFDVPGGKLNVLIEVTPNEEEHSLLVTMLSEEIQAFDVNNGTNLETKANAILNKYFGEYLAEGCENTYVGVPVEKFEEFLD
jgi:hypothetical protein